MEEVEKQLRELRKRWVQAKKDKDEILMQVIERRAKAIKADSPDAVKSRDQMGKTHKEILADAKAHTEFVHQQLEDRGFFEDLKLRYPIPKKKRAKKIELTA